MELNFKLIEDAIPLLLAGAGITLEITAMSVGFGLLIGMIIGVARLASIKPVRYAANFYVDFIRGTPLLVQIFLVYFALYPRHAAFGTNLSGIFCAAYHYRPAH